MRKLSCVLPALCICLVGQALAEPPQGPPAQSASQAAATATPSSSAMTTSPSTAPASESSAPANAGSSSSSTSTASSSASEPSKPATLNKVVLVDKTITDSQVKQLLSQGYRPQASGDGVIYCRREAELNSHFERKVCRSADAILAEMNNSKEMLKQMQQPLGSPSGH